jgi:hypothetical protein
MVHCGYDPSGALSGNPRHLEKHVPTILAQAKALLRRPSVNAFNGFSIGKGHLAEAKAAINTPLAAPAVPATPLNAMNLLAKNSLPRGARGKGSEDSMKTFSFSTQF